MEHWVIHCDRNYDAVRWPYPKSWNVFLQSPEPQPFPCDHFSRPRS